MTANNEHCSPNSRSNVSVVIPARNASRTLATCLESLTPLMSSGEVSEIILVDDGSTDETAAIARRHNVTVLDSGGRGRGAARNMGWRHASSALVWFVDSDCVAHHDALALLLAHIDEDAISGVGGSYGNAEEHSLLARLIHEEIIERHLRTKGTIVHLATYNVLFKKAWLERVNGFNESLLLGQDADLAYRIVKEGGQLAFEIRSKVDHYHQTNFVAYLRKQAGQGYWRAWLYQEHPNRVRGDSYSDTLDHLQPIIGLLLLFSTAVLPFATMWAAPATLTFLLLLLGLQTPMTIRLVRRKGLAFLTYPIMGIPRAIVRGAGACVGLAHIALNTRSRGEGAAKT